MDPKKSDECRPEIGVLPVVANKELARVDEDPKERKRERERARFASMSKERRNELNKKRRQLYQRKKVSKNMLSSCKEVMDPRLLRNERDRAHRASMPSDKREEINQKFSVGHLLKWPLFLSKDLDVVFVGDDLT